MKTNQIIKIFGTDYKQMTKDILSASHLAEMIPGKMSRIGIKPNLVVSKPAERGATTHPQIAAGIVEYLRENGFEYIIITEGCWLGEKMAIALKKPGLPNFAGNTTFRSSTSTRYRATTSIAAVWLCRSRTLSMILIS